MLILQTEKQTRRGKGVTIFKGQFPLPLLRDSPLDKLETLTPARAESGWSLNSWEQITLQTHQKSSARRQDKDSQSWLHQITWPSLTSVPPTFPWSITYSSYTEQKVFQRLNPLTGLEPVLKQEKTKWPWFQTSVMLLFLRFAFTKWKSGVLELQTQTIRLLHTATIIKWLFASSESSFCSL